MFILAYLIFFISLYRYCKKYQSPVLNFSLLYYVAASLCAVLMHYRKDNPCTILSFIYQTTIFYLFLKPIIKYGKHEIHRKFVMISDNGFLQLSYVLIGLQLFTIVFFIGYDISLLMRGDLSQIRSEMLLSGSDALGASLARTIAGTASFFYCYNILLFFYSLAFRKDKKLLLILLIISSSSRIFHALSYVGRDGLLFWILSFLFSFYLFKPYLNEEAKKLIRKVFFVCGSFAFLLITAITLSRFKVSDSGVFWSLISYFGQPIDNFASMFHSTYSEWHGPKSLFPLIFGAKVQSATDLLASVDDFEAKYGFKNNTFFSFVGNMYMSLGPFFTFIFSVIYSSYMSKKLNRRIVSLSHLTILMIVSQVAINNYFYWAYYLRVANLFLLTTPLFVYYFKRSNSKRENTTSPKQLLKF